jgi:hypothetical protein
MGVIFKQNPVSEKFPTGLSPRGTVTCQSVVSGQEPADEAVEIAPPVYPEKMVCLVKDVELGPGHALVERYAIVQPLDRIVAPDDEWLLGQIDQVFTDMDAIHLILLDVSLAPISPELAPGLLPDRHPFRSKLGASIEKVVWQDCGVVGHGGQPAAHSVPRGFKPPADRRARHEGVGILVVDTL